MKYWCLFLLAGLVSPQALPQQPSRRDSTVLQTPEQQWRTELRSALQAPRERKLTNADSGAQTQGDEVPQAQQRHLSEQERADLRQQLRQQGRGAKENRLKTTD